MGKDWSWGDQFREGTHEALGGGDGGTTQGVRHITRHGERRIDRTGQPTELEDPRL